jgi:hypothetical protein
VVRVCLRGERDEGPRLGPIGEVRLRHGEAERRAPGEVAPRGIDAALQRQCQGIGDGVDDGPAARRRPVDIHRVLKGGGVGGEDVDVRARHRDIHPILAPLAPGEGAPGAGGDRDRHPGGGHVGVVPIDHDDAHRGDGVGVRRGRRRGWGGGGGHRGG